MTPKQNAFILRNSLGGAQERIVIRDEHQHRESSKEKHSALGSKGAFALATVVFLLCCLCLMIGGALYWGQNNTKNDAERLVIGTAQETARMVLKYVAATLYTNNKEALPPGKYPLPEALVPFIQNNAPYVDIGNSEITITSPSAPRLVYLDPNNPYYSNKLFSGQTVPLSSSDIFVKIASTSNPNLPEQIVYASLELINMEASYFQFGAFFDTDMEVGFVGDVTDAAKAGSMFSIKAPTYTRGNIWSFGGGTFLNWICQASNPTNSVSPTPQYRHTNPSVYTDLSSMQSINTADRCLGPNYFSSKQKYTTSNLAIIAGDPARTSENYFYDTVFKQEPTGENGDTSIDPNIQSWSDFISRYQLQFVTFPNTLPIPGFPEGTHYQIDYTSIGSTPSTWAINYKPSNITAQRTALNPFWALLEPSLNSSSPWYKGDQVENDKFFKKAGLIIRVDTFITDTQKNTKPYSISALWNDDTSKPSCGLPPLPALQVPTIAGRADSYFTYPLSSSNQLAMTTMSNITPNSLFGQIPTPPSTWANPAASPSGPLPNSATPTYTQCNSFGYLVRAFQQNTPGTLTTLTPLPGYCGRLYEGFQTGSDVAFGLCGDFGNAGVIFSCFDAKETQPNSPSSLSILGSFYDSQRGIGVDALFINMDVFYKALQNEGLFKDFNLKNTNGIVYIWFPESIANQPVSANGDGLLYPLPDAVLPNRNLVQPVYQPRTNPSVSNYPCVRQHIVSNLATSTNLSQEDFVPVGWGVVLYGGNTFPAASDPNGGLTIVSNAPIYIAVAQQYAQHGSGEAPYAIVADAATAIGTDFLGFISLINPLNVPNNQINAPFNLTTVQLPNALLYPAETLTASALGDKSNSSGMLYQYNTSFLSGITMPSLMTSTVTISDTSYISGHGDGLTGTPRSIQSWPNTPPIGIAGTVFGLFEPQVAVAAPSGLAVQPNIQFPVYNLLPVTGYSTSQVPPGFLNFQFSESTVGHIIFISEEQYNAAIPL